MRIRTVENLEALKRLADEEHSRPSDPVDTVTLTVEAINTHLGHLNGALESSPPEKKRNIELETAVELLRMENEQRNSSLQLVRQTEKHFQQLFTASRLPIAIYDISGVLTFLEGLSVPGSAGGKTRAQFVGSRPDLSGQLLQKLFPCMRNDALQKHLQAQAIADDEGLLDHLSVRSIESFVDAVLVLRTGNGSDSECHISLDFDATTHHYHLALIPLAGHEELLDRVMLIFTPISVTHLETNGKRSLATVKEQLYADVKKNDAIIVFDHEGNFLEVSDGAQKILGINEPKGGHIEQLFVSSEDVHRLERVLQESNRQPQHLVESQQQMECACADGRKVWVTYSICCVETNNLYILVLNDVSASHRLLEHIRFQNTRDVLTNLYNRKEFKKFLTQALAQSAGGEQSHALLLIDLDFFKIINDSLGLAAGDEFLRQVANLLTQSVRVNDVVARLGGDEFGILLKNCRPDIARRIAEGITHDLGQHKFSWEQKLLPLTASVAVVTVDNTTPNAEVCLANADAAVYAAKEAGGNRFQIYDASHELVVRHQNQLHWFSRIHAALESNRFVLYAQKIGALSTRAREEGSHYELLIRMLGENGEIIAPGEFLPAAERYNLMPLIDRWVVRHAFQWFAVHGGQGRRIGMCSINVSGASLCDENFCDYVLKQFQELRVPGEKICFEITETMAIQNLQKTLEFMSRMKALGCRFSLDDFGAGFSSYGHLRTLPVDFVKIDGQFVKQMANDPIDFAMVKSINELGHLMKRQTIAEFVEDDSTIEKLKSLGVDYAQGYGVERPERLDSQLAVDKQSVDKLAADKQASNSPGRKKTG